MTKLLFQDFMIYKKLQDYLDRVYQNNQAGSLGTFTSKKLPALHLYKNRATKPQSQVLDPYLVSSSLFLPVD